MPKAKVPASDAKAISQRLRDFARRRYGSWEEFCTELDVRRTTGIAWTTKDPSVPEVRHLLNLARKANMSLNWLLLGEGPELREKPTATDRAQLLAAIQAELRATTDAREEEHELVWNRMLKLSNEMLKLAVEGVRPQYREWLRQVRQFDRLRDFGEKWTARLPNQLAQELAEDIERVVGAHEPRLVAIRVVEVETKGSD